MEAAGKIGFLVYFGISGLCLGLDYSLFLVLARLGVDAVLAGSASYLSGLVLHFLLSRRLLFTTQAHSKPIGISLAEYGLTGIFGTAVTALTLWCALQLSFTGQEAKAIACATSFLGVYALRRKMFFTPRSSGRCPRC